MPFNRTGIIEWERLEISSRKLEISREIFKQRWACFCSQGRGCQSRPLERLGPGAAEAGRASFSLCSLGASSRGIPCGL